jgi:hypothetical protein
MTLFKGKYYLFSTNQFGYWWSDDMLNWNFVYRKFVRPYNQVAGDELCAPATLVLGDTLLVIGSTYNKDFTLWMSTNPTKDDWKAAKDYFKVGAWDPGMFADDDGRVYIYHGSSNTLPLYGQEIDRKTFEPIGPKKEMIKLDPEKHGWERFGEHNDNVFLLPFIEGSWMNKHTTVNTTCSLAPPVPSKAVMAMAFLWAISRLARSPIKSITRSRTSLAALPKGRGMAQPGPISLVITGISAPWAFR